MRCVRWVGCSLQPGEVLLIDASSLAGCDQVGERGPNHLRPAAELPRHQAIDCIHLIIRNHHSDLHGLVIQNLDVTRGPDLGRRRAALASLR